MRTRSVQISLKYFCCNPNSHTILKTDANFFFHSHFSLFIDSVIWHLDTEVGFQKDKQIVKWQQSLLLKFAFVCKYLWCPEGNSNPCFKNIHLLTYSFEMEYFVRFHYRLNQESFQNKSCSCLWAKNFVNITCLTAEKRQLN